MTVRRYDFVAARTPLAVRAIALLTGLVVVAVLVVVFLIVRTGVAVYASLLCGWPATISCPDDAVPYVWPLLVIAVGVVVVAGVTEAVRAMLGGRRVQVWRAAAYGAWGTTLPVLVALTVHDRTLHPIDLVAGGLFMAVGGLLVAWSVAAWWPEWRRLATVLLAGYLLALVVVMALAPAWFRAAAAARQQSTGRPVDAALVASLATGGVEPGDELVITIWRE